MKTLKQVAAEIGMDPSALRKHCIKNGVKLSKIRIEKTRGQLALAVGQEAEGQIRHYYMFRADIVNAKGEGGRGTKHTPGPWRMNSENILQENAMGNVVMIASSGGSALKYEEKLANSRLISAAPEMLEALKALIYRFGIMSDGCIKMGGDAIAKAEGRGE